MPSNFSSASTELIIHTDGGARGNPGPAALGVVVLQNEEPIYSHGEVLGTKTNNEAEYLAFAHSVEWLKQHATEYQPTKIIWRLDSKLVIEQLNKHWKIKEPRLQVLAKSIWTELASLKLPFIITYVPRAQNAMADALVNAALDAAE